MLKHHIMSELRAQASADDVLAADLLEHNGGTALGAQGPIFGVGLKFLRDSHVVGAAWPELGSKDANSRPVANFIDAVKDVDNVEP
jgi:hypothetical protein